MNTSVLNVRQVMHRLLVGAAVSFCMLAVLLYAFSSSGQQINLSKLVDLIRNVSLWGLFWYVITQLTGVWLRSLRYRALLIAAGDQSRPALGDLLPITLIRNMTVDLLPARAGELIFVALLKKTNHTHVSHSLSSLMFATLFDVAVIVPVVLVLALFLYAETGAQLTLVGGAVIVLFALAIIYLAMKYLGPAINQQIAKLAVAYPNRGMEKLAVFVDELNQAVQTTISGRQFINVAWQTVALRITKYTGLCLLFLGVVQHNFPQLATLSITQLVTVLIAGETTASLPVPTFLSLGSYEAGAAGMLSLHGVAFGSALLIMLAVHLCSQIIDYTLGLIGVAWLLFKPLYNKVKTKQPLRNQSRLVTFLSSLTAVLAFAAVIVAFQAIRSAWSVNAPPAGTIIEGKENQQALANWESGAGFVVWSSNRNGNHDIYHMSLPQRQITQITDHPHTENLPKISPDGSQIVFQRARKTWQSFRDPEPWDVVIRDLTSGTERILVKSASEPNWTPDGTRVSFRRHNSSVFTIDINTAEEKKLFDSAALDLPENAGLQTPMLNSKDELAVTVRGPLRMTAVYKKNNPIHVGQGCQVTWSPDETFVYYIDHGGKGQNLFKRYDFIEGKNKVWLDMPGDYSHEYFPKLTHDGKWLVFAASTGGHEHDTADYELFIWQVNTDPSTATRLTYHSGNDSWPDIFINR